MIPGIIKGKVHSDQRGLLLYNNDFDATVIKRIYFIENANTSLVRAWQGHQIEQRWFSIVKGSFKILLIKVDDWENPSRKLQTQEYIISAKSLDILHIPKGYLSSIQALEEESKMLVMADYLLGEIDDEYKFPRDYFKNI